MSEYRKIRFPKCPYCGNEIEVREENIMPEPGKGMVMACKKCNSKFTV